MFIINIRAENGYINKCKTTKSEVFHEDIMTKRLEMNPNVNGFQVRKETISDNDIIFIQLFLLYALRMCPLPSLLSFSNKTKSNLQSKYFYLEWIESQQFTIYLFILCIYFKKSLQFIININNFASSYEMLTSPLVNVWNQKPLALKYSNFQLV